MGVVSAAITASLGDEMAKKLVDTKVLVVGAGGIGCELIKNLVLSGFTNLHVVDLDTIDVSNLNRQFLFRKHHVGQPKAVVAREIALKFNPAAKIVAYHGNIKTSQFGLDFFKQFTLVMNALDNVDARRHVNRLCLATDVPLVESGTTGYLGQVSVIQKDKSECYECTAKQTQKVYPICTIRSTPDKPVHCIVWAKECYKLLFGKSEESMLWEDPNGDEKSSFMHLVDNRPVQSDDNDDDIIMTYAKNVFKGLFEFEIKKKLSMKSYKTSKSKPAPVILDDLSLVENIDKECSKTLPDRIVWKVDECARRFLECIRQMYAVKENYALLGSCVFDKDDKIAMEFVTCASNLRSSIFNISQKSLYDCKGIAGNIIPAIATTNAIIAGIQVSEAFKIVSSREDVVKSGCKYTYCNRAWDSRGVLLSPIDLSPPNSECYVCSQKLLQVQLDVTQTTLQDLVDNVLKKRLGVNEPNISIGNATIYEEGEDAEESLQKHLVKTLNALPAGGITDGVIVSIEDFSQDFNLSLAVSHIVVDNIDEKKFPLKFMLRDEIEIAKKEADKMTKKRLRDDDEGAENIEDLAVLKKVARVEEPLEVETL